MKSLYFKICLLVLFISSPSFSFAAGISTNRVGNESIAKKASEDNTMLYSYTGNVQFRFFAAGKELAVYFTDGQRVNFVILQQSTLTAIPANGKYKVAVYESGISLQSYTGKSAFFLGADVKASNDLADALGGKKTLGGSKYRSNRIYIQLRHKTIV